MTAERNPPGETSLLSRPLEWLTAAALRAPTWVVGFAAALGLVAILVTCNGLEFKTSRLDLLNAKSAYNQRWLAYLDEFGDRDDAVVVVQASDPAVLRKVIDDMGEQLRARPKLFQSVMDRTDLTALRGKALHYLNDEQVALLEAHTAQLRALVPQGGPQADPGLQLARLNDTLEKVRAASPEAHQQWQRHYGEIAAALHTILQPPALQQAAGPANFFPALKEKFGNQYLLSEQGQLGFVLCKLKIDPAEMARGKQAIESLRQIIDGTRRRHPQVWIGLTGMPIIEFDEMQSSQADMLWTGLLSMAFVAILFVAGYGGLRHALLACVVLQLGMAWSFGFVTLCIGHLNILSSAFGVVVIGQGIDFSIHYVASYLKLRRFGHRSAEALTITARDVGPGVMTGAISTAAAFFAAGFTEFTGIAELGIIGGAGILLCVLATAVVLPPLIYLFDQNRESLPVPEMLPVGRWVRPLTRHPALTVASTLAITLLLTGGVAWMRYDHNLLNLQPANLESSAIERELFSRLDDSVWFAVSMCDTKEELLQRKAAFEKLPQVAKTEEVGSLLPKVTARRQQQISEISSRLSDLPQRPATVTIDARRLKREVARARQILERDTSYETPLQQQYAAIAGLINFPSDEQLAAGMSMTSAALATHALTPLRELREFSDPSPPALDDLPRQLTERYLGKNGKYLIKVYAKGNIWDLDRLGQFVREVESVDRRITGHPVQTFYASQHMQWSYIWSGGYALVAVFLLLLLDFRNLWHTLLAMTPLCLGFVQMCGLVGWLNIPFNPANMIGLPLIMGIGVDEGAHLVHEMRRQRGRFRLEDSTAIAVILTSVTTMAGFGTLILSRHQGLRSMGQLLTLGVGLCLACTVVFLPSLLVVLTRNRKAVRDGENEEEPVTVDEIESESNTAELIPASLEMPTEQAVEESEIAEPVAVERPAVIHTAAPASEPAVTIPPTAVSEISYFRFEVPPLPPQAPTSDETLSLEALHRELIAKRQTLPATLQPQELLGELPVTLRIDGTEELSPLIFGPVSTTVPRRRSLPRRVEIDFATGLSQEIAGGNGPVEPQPDQVD